MALEDDTAKEQPADDIRSALAAAVEEHSEPVAVPEKSAKPDAADTGKPAAKAAPKAPKAAKPAKEAEPVAEAVDEPAAKPEGDDAPIGDDAEKTEAEKAEAEKAEAATKAETELTGKWSAKDKETYKALPPEGKELLLRRHKEMEGAFTKKTQEIAAFRKDYEPVSKLLEPWQDRMRTAGYTPTSLITAWANVEKRLMDGDGVGVVAGLVKGYKVDLGKVAQALGMKPLAQPAQQRDGEALAQPVDAEGRPIQAVQLPPEITQQLLTLQQRLDASDRERADAQRRATSSAEQGVMTEIEKFKSADDGKGNLLHPHFDELEDAMTSLAQAAIAARKPVPPLSELYETAVWANPSTRKMQQAAEQKAQQAADAEKARAKAAAAKKAGSSVTGAPGSGQAPSGGKSKSDLSLREQLLAAEAEIAEA